MTIYIYSKTSEKINVFEDVIDKIKDGTKEIIISIEHKRNFGELEKIKNEMTYSDILVVGSLDSLGISEVDIANELNYFIEKERFLVIANMESTFEYGVSQPMNRAVLKTILDSLLADNNIVKIDYNKRSNAGRKKIEFPDNWENLYEKWEEGEISSKKFLDESGLKKATFYNMITEYKEIQKANRDFIDKYRLA